MARIRRDEELSNRRFKVESILMIFFIGIPLGINEWMKVRHFEWWSHNGWFPLLSIIVTILGIPLSMIVARTIHK